MKSFLYLVILLNSAVSLASPSSLKKQALEKAQLLFKQDSEIQSLKKNEHMAFRKPTVLIHQRYETVEMKQIYLESLSDGSKRQWFVMGGFIAAHHVVEKNEWKINKNILPVNSFSEGDLISSDSLVAQASSDLFLSHSLGSREFELHHQILNSEPVYYFEIHNSAMSDSGKYSPMSGRILVYSALTGKLLWNMPRHKYADEAPKAHDIKVLDARFHTLKTARYKDDSQVPANNKAFATLCQLISTNKESKGEPLLIQPKFCDAGKDASAQRALSNMNRVLDYYWTQHSQWGFDNDTAANTQVLSLVHIGDHFDNAYWDEDNKFMVYGDGAGGNDRDSTNDYTLALDIAGHEFTHAIVSNTANFAGPGEPGALNEAFADIFGILISRWKDPTQTWSIGAKLYHNTDGDSDEIALRSLSNPEKFKTSTTIDGKSVDVGFPDRYSKALALKETCNDDNDQCEVHANSTIWSHSAYLFNQKLQNQLNYKSTDADKLTGDLYFITLTHKLHETETMHSAGTALLQTCNELYENKVCDLVTASLREIEVLP